MSSQYEQYLFYRGFLITDNKKTVSSEILKNGNWECHEIGSYTFFIRDKVGFFHADKENGDTLFLIGHAYNPYAMEPNEQNLLSAMLPLDDSAFWNYESQLTGVYIMGKITADGKLIHWSDCAGMRISYYGRIDGYYYVTSHVNLVGSLLGLEKDKYVTKLINNRYFHLFGNVLPGDLSIFRELKRTVPNHWYSSNGQKKRFFPLEAVRECQSEEEYQRVVNESSLVLKNTLALCAKKWEGKKIAISVTGGKDSGETLASANGIYDQFSYFSYISKPEEAVDANVAHEMCGKLGLEHRIINIPEDNAMILDYDTLNEVIYSNCGSVGYISPNEVRKRSFLIADGGIDIEVKSWVNEIVRAYWYKKYSKKRFPKKPTGRYLATLYKVFLENRVLFAKTANVFRRYIDEYMSNSDRAIVGDWTTLWSWEFGFSAGEGLHLCSDHLLSFDITIPFNNRRLIATMLRPKLEDRIADRLQKDIIRKNNPQQADLNVNVVNSAHTDKRAKIERLYLNLNSHLPF